MNLGFLSALQDDYSSMSQPNSSESGEQIPAASSVPLSDRPLIAGESKTVISGTKVSSAAPPVDVAAVSIRNRLFPPDDSAADSIAGIRLAHFEIRERLGAGGMGAVFRAVDVELSREVAVKVMHPSSGRDPSLVTRFRNESRACAQLSHDNIARVYYSGTQDGLYFIAYEFARGKTLRDLILEQGRLAPSEAVNYAIQITLALNHLAAAGVVHRDIKPSNLMLTEGGRIKVVDFGLARRETDDSLGHITVAGTTLGTFDYIAPEQARDPRTADTRSDIYSLGCTLYHMLSGNPPYPEGTALQKLLDHQGKSPPDLCSVNSRVPEELAAIVGKMMLSDPEIRYQSPGVLLNDLIQLAGQLGLQAVPAEGIVWKSGSRQQSRQTGGYFWMFAAVGTVCLTALLLSAQGLLESVPTIVSAMGPDRGAVVNAEDYAGAGTLPGNQSNSTGSDTAGSTAMNDGTAETGNAAETAVANSGSSAITERDLRALSLLRDEIKLPLLPTPGVITAPLVGLGMFTPKSLFPADLSGAAASTESAAADLEGPFILQSSTGDAVSFSTLKAAVADARSGDVVLLRYNGYPDDLPAQEPVRIVGTNLIIRAAEGFRPTLQFEVIEDEPTETVQIISLRSEGSLTMRNLDLRIQLSEDDLSDRWSVLQLSGPNRVELDNVSIELSNPGRRPVALFDLTDDSQTPGEVARGETEIVMNHVISRLQGDVFRIACQPRGRIRLLNSGLAIDGRLLELRGDASMQPAQGELGLFTDHLTCIHSGPLIQTLDGDPAQLGTSPRLLPRLSVNSEASVYAATQEETPLLRSNGALWMSELEEQLSWIGFTNVYEGYSVFWMIESSGIDFGPRRLSFTELQDIWQNQPGSQETGAELATAGIWRTSQWKDRSNFSVLDVFPALFELDATLFLPGVGSFPRARDGLIPGVNPQELPVFPRAARGIPRGFEPAAEPESSVPMIVPVDFP